MPITRFAAIDVGSYELEMKIYEISSKNKLVQLDHIRHVIEIGKDTYTLGKVSLGVIHELCDVLYKFTEVMGMYKVDSYKAYATSGIREAKNATVILDRIEVKTGINVKVLSNSEQRFLIYKALASIENAFTEFIRKGTAIIDVGAGSMQISLFDDQRLVTTQNLKFGSLRIRELLTSLSNDRQHFERLIGELIDKDIQSFKRMFLKDREIKNVIAVGDAILYFAKQEDDDKFQTTMSRKHFLERFKNLTAKTPEQISEKLRISEEQASLLIPSVLVYKRVLDETDTEMIWIPGVSLCDGIAADYAINNRKINFNHDFNEDILAAARNIAKRYKTNINHIQLIEKNSLIIFDSTKKLHGLGKRERLLLQISTILHDCGKYISMKSPAECSYNIIKSTEIIGLSRLEREIVANIVKYNTMDLLAGDGLSHLDNESYIKVTKLTAIHRLANAIDRSHKQKFKDFRVELRGPHIILSTSSKEDITLERGLFEKKAELFEEVYAIKPVLKQKK